MQANAYFRPQIMHTWRAQSLEETNLASAELLRNYPHSRVFAFFGEMGSGKTTFIKFLCKTLGVHDNVSSPTFALVNQYEDASGNPVFHFDFYRIEKEQEAIDMGIGEYFGSRNYCFVEWSEKILHLLPEDAVRVRITADKATRIITADNG